MEKISLPLVALVLGTALLGACQNKSGDGDPTSHGSPGSDTPNPNSKTGAEAAPAQADSTTPATQSPR